MARLIFRQLFERVSCTYTYILACPSTKEALIIDPVIETLERDLRLVQEMGLQLRLAANTHVHADHVTASGLMKQRLPGLRSVLSAASGGRADVLLSPGEELRFGEEALEVRATPGHTDGCLTFVSHRHRLAFTGDALLIRSCGRTDFQQGDAGRLFDSVHSQIFSLPDDFLVLPAHDYAGLSASTVQEEKALNPRLTKSREEFVHLMENLGLAYPKQIDKSLPANLVCGILEDMEPKIRAQVEESLAAYQHQSHR